MTAVTHPTLLDATERPSLDHGGGRLSIQNGSPREVRHLNVSTTIAQRWRRLVKRDSSGFDVTAAVWDLGRSSARSTADDSSIEGVSG